MQSFIIPVTYLTNIIDKRKQSLYTLGLQTRIFTHQKLGKDFINTE